MPYPIPCPLLQVKWAAQCEALREQCSALQKDVAARREEGDGLRLQLHAAQQELVQHLFATASSSGQWATERAGLQAELVKNSGDYASLSNQIKGLLPTMTDLQPSRLNYKDNEDRHRCPGCRSGPGSGLYMYSSLPLALSFYSC